MKKIIKLSAIALSLMTLLNIGGMAVQASECNHSELITVYIEPDTEVAD